MLQLAHTKRIASVFHVCVATLLFSFGLTGNLSRPDPGISPMRKNYPVQFSNYKDLYVLFFYKVAQFAESDMKKINSQRKLLRLTLSFFRRLSVIAMIRNCAIYLLNVSVNERRH